VNSFSDGLSQSELRGLRHYQPFIYRSDEIHYGPDSHAVITSPNQTSAPVADQHVSRKETSVYSVIGATVPHQSAIAASRCPQKFKHTLCCGQFPGQESQWGDM